MTRSYRVAYSKAGCNLGARWWPLLLFLVGTHLHARSRIKEITEIKGVRENILIGYGIVVGLRGTGDSSGELTGQSLVRLYTKMGLEIPPGLVIKAKNVAAVIVTAKLPPFARAGNRLDVTVSSSADASSLEGGMLLITPLRAGDQNVYAVAQGPISLGGFIDGTNRAHPVVGRVVSGATIEKDLESSLFFTEKKALRLSLRHPDFTTSARIAQTINDELGGQYATAQDSGMVDVVVPFRYEGKSVELIALLENLEVQVASASRVVLNERTGTVIMGAHVHLAPVAIAHGDLSISIAGAPKGKSDRVMELSGPEDASVAQLVKGLNALGVQPKDLTAIFQALKEAGVLEVDIISL